MRRWLSRAFGVLVLALLLVVPTAGRSAVPVAQAADQWDVQVGGDVEAANLTANSFFPQVLTVRAGDTVRWSFPSKFVPHTVEFPSGNPPLVDIVPGPGPGELAFGPSFFSFPPGPPPTGAAPFDGRTQAGSGIPPGEEEFAFSLTFTTPGLYPYLCGVHGAGMHGTVQVVAAGTPLLETPAAATARGRAEFDGLVANLQERLIAPIQSTETAVGGGVTVHTVAAGVNQPAGMNALRFLPDNLTVRRGDAVVWMVADATELHTVTFTSGGPTPDFVDVRPGPNPQGPPLLVIPANVAGPVGGTTYTGQGLLNSGIIFPGNAFVLRIDAPPGTYDYLCVVHPNMKARLTVVP